MKYEENQRNQRITKWLNENSLDKDEEKLPYFYIESFEQNLPISLEKNESSDSVSTFPSSSSSDDDKYIEEIEENDSVFDSICCDKDHKERMEGNLNIRDKLNSDIVISKTIQGLEVVAVKWNTLNNDLLLKVENKLLPVHKSLLTSHSLSLREKLKKSDDLIVTVPGTISDVTAILEVIYDCEWRIDKQNIDNVLKICKSLKLKNVLTDCQEYKKFLQRNNRFSSSNKRRASKKLKDLFSW